MGNKMTRGEVQDLVAKFAAENPKYREALMADPKVLLVDEPTAGLSKMLSEEVYEMLTALTSRDDITILLVDQEIRHALKIADYVYVLELGRNKFEGPADEFRDLEKAFWVA